MRKCPKCHTKEFVEFDFDGPMERYHCKKCGWETWPEIEDEQKRFREESNEAVKRGKELLKSKFNF